MLKFYRNLCRVKLFSGTQYRMATKHCQEEQSSSHLIEKSHIEEAIKMQPFLASVSMETWEKSYTAFQNQGFRTLDFFQIIVDYPQLVSRSPAKISNSLECWRSLQFGEKRTQQLIAKYPILLDLSDKQELNIRLTLLREYVASVGNVWKLLVASPNLLKERAETIKSKFDYLTKEMRVEIDDIVKSEVLTLSLDEIKCRHIFLERLGVYKPRPLKPDPNEKSKNPKLQQIMDTSEKKFATKIAHVTLEEYEVFKELFKREMDRTEDVSDDDDE